MLLKKYPFIFIVDVKLASGNVDSGHVNFTTSMKLTNRVREWWGAGVSHDLDPGDPKAKRWEGKVRVMEGLLAER